jgi:CheY-like chemotaxis protein
VRIHSAVGAGTAFELYFPKSARPQVERPTPAPVEGRGTGTVLLVDDNRAVRLSLGQLLRAIGFTVIEAAGGHEAVATYRARRAEIDWVLMDVTMPDLDGHAAFRELRELDPAVVVVLSSGWAPADVLERFREAPPAALLPKPFTEQALRDVLARIGVLRGTPA